MKTSLKFLASLLALTASAVVGFAQATPKVALVDVAKVYDGHYSLPEQQEKAKTFQTQAREQIEKMLKDGQAMTEKFKELEEQTRNTLLTDDKRKAAADEAQKLAEEIRKKEEDVQGFSQNADAQFRQAVGAFRQNLVESISKIAVEVGKKKGATLVLDKSAVGAQGFPIIMFADASFDITEDVIAEVNKGKPASVPAAAAKPAATTAPAATTPAPAAGDAPAVSFPGLKK
ncbi:OmpH family outer membrane protein [Nibricoccus sp. IMCC34717]|uniref:OmpH family outer membrane protein n=1 Tax=Nibricoccus sp. IMCC34717 TaxID=3034021 RepID=UPI00384BD7A5